MSISLNEAMIRELQRSDGPYAKYEYRSDVHKSLYSYGTAGFRELVEELSPICFRVGIAMSLLSYIVSYGVNLPLTTIDHNVSSVVGSSCPVHLGIMITASHNTYQYNGMKCIHVDGGMIPAGMESFITNIVNLRTVSAVIEFGRDCLSRFHSFSPLCQQPTIHVGYDTRQHSINLLQCIVDGIKLFQVTGTTKTACHIQNHHVVTTPILHHIVMHANAFYGTHHFLSSYIPLRFNVVGYYDLIVQAYTALVRTLSFDEASGRSPKTLVVDCACGVGYVHLYQIQKVLLNQDYPVHKDSTTLQLCNPPNVSYPERLNEQCGSEFVQKQQSMCTWYAHPFYIDDFKEECATPLQTHRFSYCASLDGDGDRIVFFGSRTQTSLPSSKGDILLLDGDHISCLICQFINDEICILQKYSRHVSYGSKNTDGSGHWAIAIGVVQTAYANGASTAYLHSQQIPVIQAKTGVKHVHAAAHENFDVGVYFESNGHGTVVFNNMYFQFLSSIEQSLSEPDWISKLKSDSGLSAERVIFAYQRCKALPCLVNQAVGDAISDLLLIDAILYLKNWTLLDWYSSLYFNLPSRQLKVKVIDRSIIKTNENETECLAPTMVQPALNKLMEENAPDGRVFIRPSGTEDVVRIYAEASSPEAAQDLAQQAVAIVQLYCGGV
jgi:phosphoacetylglucosamine mutase